MASATKYLDIYISVVLSTLPVQIWREDYAQSKQSAKLFLQSSELGLPHPLTPSHAGECVPPPPFVPGGGGTLACGGGGGGGQTLWYSRHIPGMYFVGLCVGSVPDP